MTTIKASCPDDGEITLTADDIDLMVCSVPEWSYYAFICPKCKGVIKKPAEPHIITLLKSGGVQPQEWAVPSEVTEIRKIKTAPLTYDDLLTFHELLENDDYFPID